MPHARPRIVLAPAAPVPRRTFLAKLLGATLGGAFLLSPREGRASTQSVDPYVGELALFAFGFAPRGWAQCNGQLLPISQNTALFSLLGTYYGGDGLSSFGLPDLRGRVPLGLGQGPGLTNRLPGASGGEETHTLAATEMPQHSHLANVASGNGTTDVPTANFPARNPAGIPTFAAAGNSTLNAGHIANAGGNSPHNNMPPFLALNWCIALEGVYPPQN